MRGSPMFVDCGNMVGPPRGTPLGENQLGARRSARIEVQAANAAPESPSRFPLARSSHAFQLPSKELPERASSKALFDFRTSWI